MAGNRDPGDPSPRVQRRRADDVRFIERFKRLTGFQAQSAGIEGLPREFLARQVYPPTVLLERYARELETRTRNALHRYEPGRPSEPWTYSRLLGIRGFGVFSLLDVLEILHRHATRTIE